MQNKMQNNKFANESVSVQQCNTVQGGTSIARQTSLHYSDSQTSGHNRDVRPAASQHSNQLSGAVPLSRFSCCDGDAAEPAVIPTDTCIIRLIATALPEV